jgi:hypothetical protein
MSWKQGSMSLAQELLEVKDEWSHESKNARLLRYCAVV